MRACPEAEPTSGDGVDVALVERRRERIGVLLERAPNTQPRLLIVIASWNEPGDRPATLRDRDRFTLIVRVDRP
jgi:hypothetical protein